jgi:hypothetical protein
MIDFFAVFFILPTFFLSISDPEDRYLSVFLIYQDSLYRHSSCPHHPKTAMLCPGDYLLGWEV